MVVAATQRWIVDDLTQGAAGRWPTLQHGTHSLPDLRHLHHKYGTQVAWWMTTGHAARLHTAGLHLPLTCVDPHWMSQLPQPVSGRHIHTTTLTAAAASTAAAQPGFLKPATAKHHKLPGHTCDNIRTTARQALQVGVHPNMWIQWTTDLLQIGSEHRLYVLAGQIVAASTYRLADTLWHDNLDQQPQATTDRQAATRWAAPIIKRLHQAGRTPHAWVCDIATLTDHRQVLLEANAPWAANPYGADLQAVADTIVAATTGRPSPRWLWTPDPHETTWAQQHPLHQTDTN